ncbi:MAG: hypothetical protein CXT73_07575 [Methanobacteriota archaeon]|nr:MAG: hypothetical protein CXT73_07575 [Euryarchaeota archaeon]
MGLNSLFNLFIMRYYTDKDIPNNWSQMLIKQLTETQKEQWILTYEGLYKYINNVLHKFKLRLSDNESPIETKSMIKPSKIKWVKFDTLYNIPIKHQVLNMKIYSYKLHPKSITTFVVEEYNGAVNDYYFESIEAFDNHSLLEDINSFLSLLK